MFRLKTAEKYDPETDTWTRVSDMFSKRSTFSGAVLNDKIFAVGGYDGKCNNHFLNRMLTSSL